MRTLVKRIFLNALLVLLLLLIAAIAVFSFQGSRMPAGRPEYVALGSSFAAGAGLGPLQENSPTLCARSTGGYPTQLSQKLDLSIVDMTCGGAVTRHLLKGGQFFQGPQIRTINRQTRLVTITIGGNDLGYSSDLSLLAARHTGTLFGRLVRQFWSGPKQANERDYIAVETLLTATIRSINLHAPNAIVVLISYPTILPPRGTCAQLGLNGAEANLMRDVADQFAQTMRSAAQRTGAILVDMHRIGATHNACSTSPWTFGWSNAGLAPFHPNSRGARATANAIAIALRQSPAAVAAIGQNNAAGHQAGSVRREEGNH